MISNLYKLGQIKDLMQDLSTKHIIPYMEQKIRVLNQQVCISIISPLVFGSILLSGLQSV